MLRKIENANNIILLKLLKKINQGINSMVNDYGFLYNEEESKSFVDISNLIVQQINNVKNEIINYDELDKVFNYETILKPFAFRCWKYENDNGYEFISWYKSDKLPELKNVVSTTFGEGESFCESRYGISFDVSMDGFLGACNKDAATLIQDEVQQSIYTIGKTRDGKIVNSYNLATPIITPKQVFDKSDNDYMSKHNEIILDSNYINPKSVIYTDNKDLEMVKLLSEHFNIPIEFKKTGYTK